MHIATIVAGIPYGRDLVLLILSLTGAGGKLTKTPQNVVVLRGEDALLNCSTDATGENPITWDYDLNLITYVGLPCTSPDPGFVASSPDSPNECNLRAIGTRQHGISGPYRCNDPPSRAVATVIVLREWCYYFLELIWVAWWHNRINVME